MDSTTTPDTVPLEDVHEMRGPDADGMLTYLFYAFNTVITIQAFGEETQCRTAFDAVRNASRLFERCFSRTLPHSNIARLNAARGERVSLDADTAELLRIGCDYCADSAGCFDITIGTVVKLWDFHNGVIPDQKAIAAALPHVNWRGLHVQENADGAFAHLDDPEAAVDVGGIAKGWIADRLSSLLEAQGVSAFIVNLGGNVVAHGTKPNGAPWRVGLRDPRDKTAIIKAVALCDASAVTSGVYERCFEKDGVFYHHILDPSTGYPVETDVAGVTVISQHSIDAEGYSTTLLALGVERGIAFAREHPAILHAYFVDHDGIVHEA